jgi:hypothetical protein
LKEETGANEFKIGKIIDMNTWEEDGQGYYV